MAAIRAPDAAVAAIRAPDAAVAATHAPDAAIARLADRQHGIVAHQQLVALGLSRMAIDRRRRKGLVRPLHRRVYAFGHLALTEPGQQLAAVLACGPAAILSHRTAAGAWGMLATSPDERRVVTVVGRHCRPRPGITVHHVKALAPVDITDRRGIPITSPARTLIDLAASLSSRELERAFDEGRVAGVISPGAVAAALERYPGRRGAGALRAVLEPERGRAVTRSMLEERFLELIRRARLPAPEVNVGVGGYTVDFLWRGPRVIVELDGYRYHSTRTAFERDREKDLVLHGLGYELLRFTLRQLEREPELTLVRVATALTRGELAA